MKKWILWTALTSLALSCSAKEKPDLHSVQSVDLNRYLGKWYEIARLDHSFERGMVGVTADYSLREDRKIKVVNSGYVGGFSGAYKEAVGKAINTQPNTPGRLKVSFFWFFYGGYNILALDNDYQWALVGGDTSDYLWILSRTPQMEDSLYQQLLEEGRKRGYAVEKIIKVAQRDK